MDRRDMPADYYCRNTTVRCLSIALLTTLVFSGVLTAQAATRSALKLWVVEATTEGREKPHYDKGLDAIRDVLSALPHDTYRKVRAGKHTLSPEGNTRITLTNIYTLEAAAPVAASDGRHRLRLRILMKTDAVPPREIEAVSTELLLIPDKHVLVRGLKQKGGKELLLVLALSPHTQTK